MMKATLKNICGAEFCEENKWSFLGVDINSEIRFMPIDSLRLISGAVIHKFGNGKITEGAVLSAKALEIITDLAIQKKIDLF